MNTRIVFITFITLIVHTSCRENKQENPFNNAIEIVAHRGANRLAPENTYASARKAIEIGADYIEIDLRKSKDGVYYLFHDKTLGRTTNGKGLFAETNSGYIDTLDAGSWFNHLFAGERIPRFEEYLKWVKGKMKVYIDVKDINIEEVVKLIHKYSMEKDCFFYFRNINDIKQFRLLAPDLQLKMNAGYPVQIDSLINIYNPQIIETSPQYLTDELVTTCHNKGVRIMVYTPGNDWKNYRKVLLAQVDMIQVDNPDIFKYMMDNKGEFPGYELIAHRGGIVEDKYNEFDPRSIQEAIDDGYYMLEIDVHESKDGVLIVNHDSDFNRFFNHTGKVKDLTWDEIKELKSEKGGYHPLSFEEVAKMCSGRVRLMIDIKPNHPSPEFFKKLGEIMEKYDLLTNAYFIDKEARKYFWGKAKFEIRVNEAMEIKKKFDNGENVCCHYFLFDHGNRLNAEAVKWCQKNNMDVVVSVNIGHYRLENHLDGASRDIEYWKSCGITKFQIDSDYDKWLPGRYNIKLKQ